MLKKTILVVDDEPRYVRLMEANLISEGFDVLKTYDGQSAVELVADKQPDLVLLDVMMPGLNGRRGVASHSAGCRTTSASCCVTG